MSDYNPGPGWREVPPTEAKAGREYLKHNTAETVQVWVREAPVPALPTAPYSVILTRGKKGYSDWVAIWYGEEWHLSANGATLTTEALLARIASFEVLAEPRAITAKAVLDRVREAGWWGRNTVAFDEIAHEFGVES